MVAQTTPHPTIYSDRDGEDVLAGFRCPVATAFE
jgi:hypothetical protein